MEFKTTSDCIYLLETVLGNMKEIEEYGHKGDLNQLYKKIEEINVKIISLPKNNKKHIEGRPGKTMIRKLEGFLGTACNINDDELEPYNVMNIFNTLNQDKISSIKELSNIGVVRSLGVVSYLQKHFTKTIDSDGDEEYLADLHDLQMALKQLDQN